MFIPVPSAWVSDSTRPFTMAHSKLIRFIFLSTFRIHLQLRSCHAVDLSASIRLSLQSWLKWVLIQGGFINMRSLRAHLYQIMA